MKRQAVEPEIDVNSPPCFGREIEKRRPQMEPSQEKKGDNAARKSLNCPVRPVNPLQHPQCFAPVKPTIANHFLDFANSGWTKYLLFRSSQTSDFQRRCELDRV
jgi:hypothetical protein